jgi:hypothetical protein
MAGLKESDRCHQPADTCADYTNLQLQRAIDWRKRVPWRKPELVFFVCAHVSVGVISRELSWSTCF